VRRVDRSSSTTITVGWGRGNGGVSLSSRLKTAVHPPRFPISRRGPICHRALPHRSRLTARAYCFRLAAGEAMLWSVLQVRGVAQSGSAPALGAGGPGFESRRPDKPFLRPLGPLVAPSRAGSRAGSRHAQAAPEFEVVVVEHAMG
jgi:hypothetical protein